MIEFKKIKQIHNSRLPYSNGIYFEFCCVWIHNSETVHKITNRVIWTNSECVYKYGESIHAIHDVYFRKLYWMALQNIYKSNTSI